MVPPDRGPRVKPGDDEWRGLRTPRGAAARVALHAGAVAHQSEVAAFAAGFALVALGAGLGALLGGRRLRMGLRVGPVELVERGGGLRLLGLQRGGAGGRKRGDVRCSASSSHPPPAAPGGGGGGGARGAGCWAAVSAPPPPPRPRGAPDPPPAGEGEEAFAAPPVPTA